MSDTNDKGRNEKATGGPEPATDGGAQVTSRGSVSDTTTRGVRIQVRSTYLPDHSSPRDGEYFFTRLKFGLACLNVASRPVRKSASPYPVRAPEKVNCP